MNDITIEKSYNSLGFSLSLSSSKPFTLLTNVVYGSNAIEHGINLIEEELDNNNRNKIVLVLVGWNPGLADPIFWELEPRGFNIIVKRVLQEPNSNTIINIINDLDNIDSIEAIIAMGTGAIMDTAKIITLYLNSLRSNNNSNGIDICTNKIPSWLQGLLDNALEKKIINKSSLKSKDSSNDVIFATIPNVPCLGAELSNIATITRSSSSLSLSSMINTMISNGVIDNDIVGHHKYNDLIHKEYIKTPVPTLCLIQPNLAYRSARMDIINYRIIAMISTCIDIILADPGYLPEMLAWDSLSKLVPIVDIAIDKAQHAIDDYRLNTTKYTEWTMHDDLDDPEHNSQFFRRYGHAYDINTIVDISRVSSSVATAKTAINVSGLQLLVDTIGASVARTRGYSYHISYLLPKYLQTLSDFSNDVSAREDPYKAFLRVKIDEISEILTKSSYIAGCAPNKTFNEVIEGLKKYLPLLSGIRRDISLDTLTLEPLHITDRDCTGLKLIIKEIAPEAPIAHLSALALRSILYNEGNVTQALSNAADEIQRGKLNLEEMGLIEDIDSEPSPSSFWIDDNNQNKADETNMKTNINSNQINQNNQHE